MADLSATDRITRQILAVMTAMHLSIDAVNPDRASKALASLVGFIVGQGTASAMDIRQYVNAPANISMYFDVATGKVLTPATGNYDIPDPTDKLHQNLFYVWNAPDISTKYFFFLVFTNDGYPVFVCHSTYTGSDWRDVMGIVTFVVGSVVSFAFPALGATIGQAVMGAEAAATYPAIASAIGNACVQTVMSGGDIESAALGAIGSVAGVGVGGLVSSATDSTIIAQAASAATRAVISGGDPAQAVASSMISSGINHLDTGSFFQPVEPITPAPITGDAMNLGDYASSDDFWSNLGTSDLGAADIIGDSEGIVSSDYDFGIDANGNIVADTMYDPSTAASLPQQQAYDFGTALNTATVAAPSGAVATGSDGAVLTNVALTALKLIGAYTAAGNQAPRTSSQTTKANPNGTLTQLTSSGQTVVSKMPVGTPYLASNGNLIVNNGDGTYTTTAPNGTQTRTQYPATIGAGSSLSTMLQNPMVLAGVGLVAVLLLTQRRGT